MLKHVETCWNMLKLLSCLARPCTLVIGPKCNHLLYSSSSRSWQFCGWACICTVSLGPLGTGPALWNQSPKRHSLASAFRFTLLQTFQTEYSTSPFQGPGPFVNRHGLQNDPRIQASWRRIRFVRNQTMLETRAAKFRKVINCLDKF